MKKIAFALLVAAVALGNAQVRSEDNYGSLVPQKWRNPMVDRVARQPGDILTILVSEKSASTLAANTAATKTDDNNVPKQDLPYVSQIRLLQRLFGGMRTKANSTTGGSGTTSRTGDLTARISATVKEVLPNGNLVIEGTRWVQVNKDTQILTLTGVVRPEDVRRDNTVLSESIADAKLSNDGKGMISDRQRKGILTRILDWLF